VPPWENFAFFRRNGLFWHFPEVGLLAAARVRTWFAMGEDEDVDLGRHGTPRSISHLNHCEIVDLDESRKRYPHVFQRLKGEDFVYFTFESL